MYQKMSLLYGLFRLQPTKQTQHTCLNHYNFILVLHRISLNNFPGRLFPFINNKEQENTGQIHHRPRETQTTQIHKHDQ